MRGPRRHRRNRLLAGLLATACLGVGAAHGQETITSLIGIVQGGHLSDLAAGLGEGGYELQDGTWQPFYPWYHTDWPELHIDLLTQRGPDNGLIWGIGTGESGPKYQIAPSFKIGVITQTHPSPQSTLSLSVSAIFGGKLTEDTCEADYGVLGTYTVNCRLAATQMPPEETLEYLVNAAPARLSISVSFHGSF